MSDSDYWRKRLAWDMYEQMEDAEATADLVARVYRSASSQIVFAAQDIFEKYMTKHKLSQTEAWNLLNRMQDNDSIEMLLLELKNKNSGENKQELIKELEAPAYRVRIERLQDLLQQVDAVMKNVYQQEQQFDTSFFEQLAENAYYKTIYNTQCRTGLGFSFSHVDQKQVDRALRMNWSGKHYSNRIWKNTDDLAKTVKDELLVSLLTGRTDRETAAVITEKFGGGAIKARRLIRTESCFLSGELTAQAYEECDIQKYRYVATLDLRTSKICRELDGKTFLVSQRQAGKNYPPMHPWCRSTTISVIDDETLSKMTRAAYNPETGRTERVPANMTYKEWYEKYVKGNPDAEVQEKAVKNASADWKQYDQYRESRQSKFSERFTELNNGQKDTITARRLMNNLNKTEVGKETVSYISEHPELNINMCYKVDAPEDVLGLQDGNDIYIYASRTATVQKTAETIVHEVTHHRYDIGGNQWSECVCRAQEIKHRKGVDKLTGEELRDIIKSVKKDYPDYKWR
jgi:SPP1 gp7 family putative phage head morphogenesis protein